MTIIAGELDAASLAARLSRAEAVQVSPIVIYEVALGLARLGKTSIDEAMGLLDSFLDKTKAEVLALDAAVRRDAVVAFERFGKGRHPAGLNTGDCFAYACAQSLDVPLLCKDDFPQTDLTLA